MSVYEFLEIILAKRILEENFVEDSFDLLNKDFFSIEFHIRF